MTAPSSFAIALYVDDTDVTDYAPFKDMLVDDLQHDVSRFKFRLENPSITPVERSTVKLETTGLAENYVVFSGYIIELNEMKRDNGITTEYEIEAADNKVRLQKSVIPPLTYDGIDADIIDDLFNDAYPDLTDLFNFTDGVDSFAEDLSLDVNDDNLLDMLNNLADQAGADWSIDRGVDGQLIRFGANDAFEDRTADAAAALPRYLYTGGDTAVNDPTGGNPKNCIKWTGTTPIPPAFDDGLFTLQSVQAPATITPTNIRFDYKITGSSLTSVFGIDGVTYGLSATSDGAWHSIDWLVDVDAAATWAAAASHNILYWKITATSGTAYDLRIDNFEIITDDPFTTGNRDKVNWAATPPSAPFDLDIDTSDEFAFDIDLDLGSYDNFNSITVIGGSQDITINETYFASGYQTHFDLYAPVKDILVDRNTGTDLSPNWVAQNVGLWGVDENGVAGIGVLYSEQYHFLLWNSAPSNLGQAFRVRGTIQKPIRVRVENVPSDGVVFAETVYNDKVSSEAEAATVGFAELNKRNSITRLAFKTYEPGLKVGQAIQVTDAARGLSESIVINRIRIEWIGSNTGLFEVECGDTEYSGIDLLVANNDKRSRPKAPPVPVATSVLSALTDDNGELLTDDNNQVLYVVTT